MASITQNAIRSTPPRDEVGRKRTKPTPDEGTVQITFRLDVEIVRQLDAEAERIGRDNSGLVVGRTDVLRMLITDSLARRSKRHK